jgi:hypothetical protein
MAVTRPRRLRGIDAFYFLSMSIVAASLVGLIVSYGAWK